MQTDSTSYKWFCDLFFKGQMLYTCKGSGLRTIYPQNTELEDTLVDDYLVKKWPLGNTLLLVEDSNGKLGIADKGVPTPKEASIWSVPEDLMKGWAHTAVEFDILHKVEARCVSFFPIPP
jgi:hypothetical protein